MKLEYVYGSAHCYISDYNNGSLDNTDFLTPEFGADFKPIGAGKESEAVFRVTLSEIDDVTQTESETTAQTTAGNAETAPPPLK